GPSIAKGYYKDPETTAKVFAEDGFFYTGDYASIDKKGRIFLAGRKKNTIVLENGKNVYPEEVEREFENTLDYIKELVVYQGDVKFDKETRTVLCMGVYLDPEQNIDQAKIKADILAINKTLPVYKRIAYVDFVDSEYEKTSTRKIKREQAATRHTKDKGMII
ncbi:MAG: long-chain fatty acid--CoA ligase, partial [Clostridiales bacterium]|nr:long-chain fatty acid--CoA ligase [Clostridiales bacterium]